MNDLTSRMTQMKLNGKTNNDHTDEKANNNNNNGNELECHARIIAFFAHKGGVSKTTNVYHLGYMLAQHYGYKVLMIDADPQQNLTQTCCKHAKTDADWRDEIDRGTIYTAMERLHYGMKDGNYIDPANCVRLHKKRISNTNTNEENELNNINETNEESELNSGELWLLPGSLDLAKLEPQITFAHNINNPAIFPIFDDIAGGFRHLFISTCAHYDIDFCLIDMGPSIGELNKSLFFSSDYFLIPCSPDSYCKTTMKTMERTLPLWREQQKRLAQVTQDMMLYVNPDPPKFLGILMGLYQVSGKNKNAVKDSQHWMDIIKQTVVSELVPCLKKCEMVQGYAPKDFTLAEIPHFLSLMPIAQKSHSPVYDIPDCGFVIHDEDGNVKSMSKTEVARHRERAKWFYEKYQELAQLLIEMLDAEVAMENDAENEGDASNVGSEIQDVE